MKFIYFLLLLLSCSNSSILHKTLDYNLISSCINLNKIDSLLLKDSSKKPIQLLIDDPKLSLSYDFSILDNMEELKSSDRLNQEKPVNLGIDMKKSWYEENKEYLNFIYGTTIAFITYTIVRWN